MLERLELDLSNHCIKTEIKKQYEKNLSLCLKGAGSRKTEALIEILKSILEKNDFGFLRGKYKALAGKTDALVFLHIEKDKKYVSINNENKVNLL
ncbi:MAG: hypothetical protein CSB21_01950 [Deltaproteobacteria bacterium]|nr:MAG: hypothetical protein CSB21_01950 [Deltaproteobacteria bacterium]